MMERSINRFRYIQLAVAEVIDVWRVIPRTVIAVYTAMLWLLVKWFTNPAVTIEKITCDSDLILKLLLAGMEHSWIERMACTVTDVIIVAPPTTVHATFASVVAGLSTAVFALYTTSARDWSNGAGWWRVPKDQGCEKVSGEAVTIKPE